MKITITDYQDTWKELFAGERENIYSLISFLNPVIVHIGSTSVPGLCAKPVIDIQVGLQNNADLDPCNRDIPMLKNLNPTGQQGAFTANSKTNRAYQYQR